MSLSLTVTTLRSRTTQAVITAARQAGKALSGIIPKLKKFAGWLFTTAVSFFHLSWTNLWDLFVNAYYAIKFFDFNATDAALEKQMEENNKFLANIAGQAIGNYLGFQAVRLANTWIGKFTGNKANAVASTIKIPVISAEVGLMLAHEANSQLAQQFRVFLQSTASAQISNFFISSLLAARKNHFLGLSEVTKPITNGSISAKIDKLVEQLPEFWRQPAQNAIQGFEMGVIQAGYIVTYQIDDHIAAARYARLNNGYQRKVEVVVEPDSNEKLEIQGTQDDVEEVINEATLATIPLLVNRDVGQIFGEPVNEEIKLKPQLRQLVINFNEHKKPPYTIKGVKGVRTSISIPDAKAGIEWIQLKEIIEEYVRGQWFCSVELTNGRQMMGWFDSPTEGERVLGLLSTLSQYKTRQETFRSSKGVIGGIVPSTKVMFPHYASLLYPSRKEGLNVGIKGTPQKVNLWPSKQPSNFKGFI